MYEVNKRKTTLGKRRKFNVLHAFVVSRDTLLQPVNNNHLKAQSSCAGRLVIEELGGPPLVC